MCKWECSTEPEDWELVENELVAIKQETFKDEDDEEDAPEPKRIKETDSKPTGLTKFHMEKKVYILSHRDDKEKGKKSRAAVTCAHLSDKREYGIVGFDDGVFLILGLPGGELIQEMR